MRKLMTTVGLVLALVVPGGQQGWASTPTPAAEPLRVVSTIGMIGDLVTAVGGECARTDVLIGPGLDPHLYQPRPSDIGRLQQAEVIFHLGLNLEGQMGQVLERMDRDGRKVLALGETAVPESFYLDDDGAVDPHLWMDVALWSKLVPVVAQELALARPDCAVGFDAGAAAFLARLDALHAWSGASLASIPETARVLVTAHDAFGYFARAYGMRQEAIQGFSTESEASVADIRAVAQAVVSAGVPAVFVESTISPRTVEAMLEAVTAMGGQAVIGGALFADAMGPEGTPEGSYIGMIRANVIAITTALGGAPAPWPEALAGWARENGLAP